MTEFTHKPEGRHLFGNIDVLRKILAKLTLKKQDARL
jgi:hypothetical protein